MILNIKKKSPILLLLAGMICLSSTTPDRPMMVYFLGDSITRMGSEPDGYITQLKHLIDSTGRGRKYNLSCAGEDGNTLSDLALRLDRDIISRQPDIVFILIGVNDAYKGSDTDKFLHTYDTIIQHLRSIGTQVIICTPMCISERKKQDSPKDKRLDRLAYIVRDIAAKYKCELCDIRKAYLELKHSDKIYSSQKVKLTTDGIHPNHRGSQIIAQEMSKFLK